MSLIIREKMKPENKFMLIDKTIDKIIAAYN